MQVRMMKRLMICWISPPGDRIASAPSLYLSIDCPPPGIKAQIPC
jgi:hypothetical protein